MKAKITGVAVRFQGKVYSLPRPNRHCDVLKLIVEETGCSRWTGDMEYDQGFIDADGVYLHRKAAKARAHRTGQLLECASVRSELAILFSEDVW